MSFFKIAYGDEESKELKALPFLCCCCKLGKSHARREESATSLWTGKVEAVERFLVFKDLERLVEKWQESWQGGGSGLADAGYTGGDRDSVDAIVNGSDPSLSQLQ